MIPNTRHQLAKTTSYDVTLLMNELDRYFTDASAWEFIASKLEQMHPVEVIHLNKPEGAKGYVMKIDIDANSPKLYVKLQLGAGKKFWA